MARLDIDWEAVDWGTSNAEIGRLLRVSDTCVATYRKRFGHRLESRKKRSPRRPRERIAYEIQGCSFFAREIAEALGVNYEKARGRLEKGWLGARRVDKSESEAAE